MHILLLVILVDTHTHTHSHTHTHTHTHTYACCYYCTTVILIITLYMHIDTTLWIGFAPTFVHSHLPGEVHGLACGTRIRSEWCSSSPRAYAGLNSNHQTRIWTNGIKNKVAPATKDEWWKRFLTWLPANSPRFCGECESCVLLSNIESGRVTIR